MRRKQLFKKCLLIALILCVPALSFGREKVQMKMKNATVASVINVLSNQYGYSFVYQAEEINPERIVSIDVEDASVEQVLQIVFRDYPIAWKIDDKVIILSSKDFQVAETSAPVTGIVYDETGAPMMGVGILEKSNPRNGVVTNLDGSFSIGVRQGSILRFSFIGYKDLEVAADGRRTMKVSLVPDSELLEGTVVVGYGSQKKVNLTGAVAVVDGEQLTSRSAPNVADMLKGALPNVHISTTGRAGDGATLNIRGVTSIASTTEPMVLVDGVECNILDVNPSDIESISVLKDASASAVYGSRAGFGVILITTKKGSTTKLRATYNGKFSVSSSTTSTDYETRGYYSAYICDSFFRTYQGTNYTTYTADDYHELWLRRNDAVEDPSRPWVIEKNGEYKYYGNFDWFNYLFDNTRPTTEHNVSVSGGTDKINFLFSGSYYKQKGVNAICPDHYVHYNFRSKVSAQITPWLEISNNTSYSDRDQQFPGSSSDFGNYYSASWGHALSSIVPINPDGSLVFKSSVNPSYAIAGGVAAIAQYGKHRMNDQRTELRTTFEAVIKPLKGLEARVNYSFTDMMYHAFNRFVDVPYSLVPGKYLYMSSSSSNAEDRIQESFNKTMRDVFNAYATYKKDFEKFSFSLMAGTNYEHKRYKNNYMRRDDLLSDDLSDFNVAVGNNIYTRGGQNEYAILGFFYRANLNFKEKYLLELSGRYDGSSRFAKGHRFGFFPSFSAGWRISQEDFFSGLRNTVNNLKLRYSYGLLGNQSAVGYYDYIQTISTSNQLSYSFGDNKKAYYAAESAPNATDITWEKITTNNLGVDMSMFSGRLNLTADAYIRDTKDMIMQSQALPAGYGAAAPKNNSADLRTKGYEVSLSFNDHFELAGDDFTYGISAGLGDNVSYVTRYDNPSRNLSSPYVGQKLGDIWGYRIDGYFLTDEEADKHPVNQTLVNNMIMTEVIDQGLHAGDLKYRDLDGNGIIEETTSADDIKDMEVIGNSLPRYNYSFTLNSGWKGFDISLMFQGIGKQNWYPGGECLAFWGPYSRPYSSFIPKDFMSQVWSETNTGAYFPRPRGYVALDTNRELGAVNDRYLQNVGYLRLKNLTFGYSLPAKVAERMHITRFRLYFSGENLLTFSPLHSKYLDPEQASASLSWNNYSTSALSYPYARTFTVGLEITL